ncbi:serine-rich adhesin for platelets isoform X3 [Contarinia nasturtii]|uniref:serine-rich adhesin for platelets isoform X3 n=1 Tax=Contarinia nasturtii TaxID=265458 RepID=UPI0012D3F7D4|nr:serine-rich adhesin for platelets isoform X3 [Contarinia nasturtii]
MSATSTSLPSSAATNAANNENVMETSQNSLRNPKSSSKQTASSADKLGVCLQGYLKKQKTMKKKYFVLVSNNGEKPARLEYYDSEKKFRSRFGHPKRSIVLKSCFHISQRLDTKQKFVIALYTREDSFCIVMENESEMNKWLDALQILRQHEESEVDLPRTTFEHVWEVQVHRRGLAVEKNIVGTYHLCLTDKALRLSQTGSKTTQNGEQRMPYVEFLLTTIRRCGDSQRFFYMEVGRHSAIGAGELYMETEDPLIAQNMHTTIINAMSTNRNREEFGGPMRNRSSSANEASKPILVLQRRQTHVGSKTLNFSPSNGGNSVAEHDDDATYLITPNHDCQNPSHAHHISHHRHHGVSSCYRYHVADTVVEESTDDSIVTVISSTPSIRANESPTIPTTPTPNIILTNSETVENETYIEETSLHAARSLSINKLTNKPDEAGVDPMKLSPSSASLPSPSLLTSPTIAQATDSISNYKETAQNNNNNNINNNNSQTGIATSVRSGAVVTTTITTIVSQNPCQTVITSTSYSTNSLKATATTTASAINSPVAIAAVAAVAAGKAGTSSFTNLTTTCNPQYLRSVQSSSSYHRRHSVSVVAANSFSVLASNELTVSHQRAFSLPITTTALLTTTTSSSLSSPSELNPDHHSHCKTKSLTTTNPTQMMSGTGITTSMQQLTKSNHLSSFHQRTRSLPHTEEESPVVVVDTIFPSSAASTSSLHSSVECNAPNHPSMIRSGLAFYSKNSISSLSSVHSSSNSSITAVAANELNGSSILRKLCETMCTTRNADGSRKHLPTCCFYQIDKQAASNKNRTHKPIKTNDQNCNRSNINNNNNSNNQNQINSECGDSAYLLMTSSSSSANRKAITSTTSSSSATTTTVSALRCKGCNSHRSLNLRDRCGSLPTHNRTTSDGTAQLIQNQSMPPPRTIPLAITGRPHSMYTNSYRHSPPVNSNNGSNHQPVPLSPSLKTFSKSCSESDGSSLSIDEPDGCFTPDESNGFPVKTYNPCPSGSVIPEENVDEFVIPSEQNIPNINGLRMGSSSGSLSLPIQSQQQQQQYRTESPQSSYSPYGNSPVIDQPNHTGYMMMSPGTDYNKGMFTGTNSCAHSQTSSLAEDCVDSYVPVQSGVRPMGEEYIDMEQNHRHANNTSSMSSAASSCSITSGTPSTDLRFAEYQLDKVVSHFTPDDDDPSMFLERPIRAYSVGSRLEHNKRKMRVDMLSAEHSNNTTSRVRAFSVGSRAKVARSDLYRGLINSTNLLKANSQDIANLNTTINNNKTSINSMQKNQNALNNNITLTSSTSGDSSSDVNKKSNSSLYLTNGPRSTESCHSLNNAKSNSIDPMDDLMEIDFTKKDDDSLSTDSSYDPKHSSCYDLMEIEYPQNANQSDNGKRKKSASISGTSCLKEAMMTTRVSQPVPIARRSNDGPDSDGYMSMKPVGSSDSKHSINSLTFQRGGANPSSSMSSSPTKHVNRTASISSPGSMHRTIPVQARTHQNSIGNDDYLNMSPVNVRATVVSKISSQLSQHQQQLQQQHLQQQHPQQQQQQTQQQQIGMHHVGSGGAPDGYMEMSWNNRTTANNSNNLNNNNKVGHVIMERNRQSSSSSISSSNEYIDMNFGGNIPRTSSASSDCSSTSSIEISTHAIESRNSRIRSLPITIKKTQSQPTNAKTISKQTIGTQPQNHPIIHSFAASKMIPPTFLSLNTNLKSTSAQTSSDSTSECSITTPTGDLTSHNASSSTIFPFSPNSPNNGVNKQIFSSQSMQLPCEEQNRKCFVDGTTGTLRLSESESDPTTPSAFPANSATIKPIIPLDVLSSDYADMTIGGNSSKSIRNTGPTLSPKENIKKLKSSFFGCSKIDETKMECTSPTSSSSNPINIASTMTITTATPTNVTTNSKNSTCDEGDYTIMNPVMSKRIVAQQKQPQQQQQQQQPPQSQVQPAQATFPLKKTALVTTNNDPDKVLANTQVKNSIDGFKPITSRADKEVFQQSSSSNSSSKSVSTAGTSFSRQHSAPVEKQRKPSADNGGYELLELRPSSSSHSMGGGGGSSGVGRIVRPNSVNSEKTTFTPLHRPNSANSERQSTSTFSLTSTPLNELGTQSVHSSSSTLCGSGTNITRPSSSSLLSSGSDYSQSSRPSSVISVIEQQLQQQQSAQTTPTTVFTSRPPSVSSERELHYASLDLPACSSTAAAPLANNNTVGNLASIQNPITGAEAPTFTYAQIDFVKSNENSSTNNNNNNNNA